MGAHYQKRSLALAEIEPISKTLNRYDDIARIYAIVEGEGRMHPDGEIGDAGKGDDIVIPPKS